MKPKYPPSSVLSAAIATLGFAAPAVAAQPEIDRATQWTVEQQTFAEGKASLVGLRKNVRSSTGNTESIPCFGEITVPGVIVDGQSAPFVRAISQEQHQTGEATEYIGVYEAQYGGQSLAVRLVTQLYTDGKFKVTATPETGAQLGLQVPVFLNYDFHGPGHDLFEFAWNVASNKSIGLGAQADPPLDQSPLLYTTGYSSIDTVDYFVTVPNGVAVTYRGLFQGSKPSSIAYTALARAYDAYAKLGFVLWPWSDDGQPGTDYTLIFQRRSDGASLTPVADPSALLQQSVSYVSKLPSYGVDGIADQAVTVVLEGTAGGGKGLQVAGKLFQKSAKRELRVDVHTWDNLLPWVPAGQAQPPALAFDPDRLAMGPGGRSVSFRQGLAELVSDSALVDIAVHTVDPSVADSFSSAMSTVRDFSVTSLEDVERWHTDLLIFPGSSTQQGIMPDILGGSNGIEREGAQLSWNAVRADAQKHAQDGMSNDHWSVQWQLDRATIGGLHELGHSFGFTHEMALNHTPSGDITDLMNNAADHMATVFEYRFAENCANWFRVMPEGWTMPGRYGTWFALGYPYDSTPVDPLYTPTTMPQALLGDVDHGGVVDITDALRIAQATVGLNVAGDYYSNLADVSCDGAVTIVDALRVARYVVRLDPEPTCPAS